MNRHLMNRHGINSHLKKVHSVLVFFIVLVVSGGVSADGDTAIKELNLLLKTMSSMQASFTQVTTDEEGEVLQEDLGELKAKRPGLFKSHITEPFEQLTVINQDNIWQYDPELETVSIKKVDSQSLELPTLLVSGDEKKIADTFRVSRRAENSVQSKKEDVSIFHLVPLNENRVYEWMELSFKNKQVSEIKMFSSLGETTTIRFSDLQLNPIIEDSEFFFTPPEGTDILVDN